jgi:hypothetical protein
MRRSYPTKITPYGPGSGVLAHRRGHLLVNAHILPLMLSNVNFCCIIFA